jgi:hypothetical protein
MRESRNRNGGDGRRGGRGALAGGAGRRVVPAALWLGLVLACGCGRSQTLDNDAAKVELKNLERVLADTADLDLHPVLTDGDIDPLRMLRIDDPRVGRAREACVRQYEAIAQTYDQNQRCQTALDLLEKRMHDLRDNAADPAALVAEAERACVPAFKAEERIGRARQDCDREIGRVRQALGLPR